MPTLKQYRENTGKLLKNEISRRARGWISDDTLLLQGFKSFDPRIKNDSVDRKYIRLFSVYFGDMWIIEYLEKRNVITNDESRIQLSRIRENMRSDLIQFIYAGDEFTPLFIKVILPWEEIEKLTPVERSEKLWDVWDRYFDFIKPSAYGNADTYLQTFKQHWDRKIITCTCGNVFIAKKSDSKYCPECKKKHAAVLVFRGKNKKNPSKKECPQCHEMFTPKRDTGIFCSNKCRVKYHRKNKITSSLQEPLQRPSGSSG
jgi:hypothetical protein